MIPVLFPGQPLRLTALAAAEVAHRAGDDRHAVTMFNQAACQFMMAGAASFIQRGESLVNQ